MSFLVKLFAIPSVLFVLFVCVAESQRNKVKASDTTAVPQPEPPQTIHVPMCEPVKYRPWSNEQVKQQIRQTILDMLFTDLSHPGPGRGRFTSQWIFRYEYMKDLQIRRLKYGSKALWYVTFKDVGRRNMEYEHAMTFYVDQVARELKPKERIALMGKSKRMVKYTYR